MADGEKKLLDGYVGVKFRAVRLSSEAPPAAAELFGVFRRSCTRLRAHGMTPANGGNLSVRGGHGFFITASGCNLGCMEEDELVFVERCDAEKNLVEYRGPHEPSSESIMHRLIYGARPEAGAIIHAHDELATRPERLEGRIEESRREEPYGTVELARAAIETFARARSIIVLKNHGYVAVGPDLDRACDLVVSTHLELLGAGDEDLPLR